MGVAGAAVGGLATAAIAVGSAYEEQMSIVQSISGATADEMVLLSEKAKYMGATTQFTAKEAGEAFQFMAMAGWSANDMLAGLEGVMYAAGAAGEDLGLVADIITDGLTSFGESANQAGRFADVLAAAASNSNTNIGMMGETFKYVAPVAGAMGYSIEDTAVAIGLMANSSIKASSAGTALRNILSNMANPTETVEKAMNNLGLSLTDTEGEMKSLEEVMGDIRGAFDGVGISAESFINQLDELDQAMEDGTITEQEYEAAFDSLVESVENLTDAEKVQQAAMLAGKYGMSGFLAIANATDEDIQNLTESIYNSAGAAEEMNGIRLANFRGDIALLNSALQGLGIEFYESVSNPLRDVTQTATEMVDRLNGAFQEGGLGGMLTEVGGIVADVATMIAQEAPAMIDAAVSMVSAFVGGIQSNLPTLIESGFTIINSLIEGISNTVHQIAPVVSEIVPLAVDAILQWKTLIFDVGLEIIAAIAQGMADNVDQIIESGVNALDTLVSSLSNNLPVILEAGLTVIQALIEGITAALPTIVQSAAEIIGNLVTGLANALPELIPAAVDMILTLAVALIDNLPAIIEASLQLVVGLAQGLIDAIPVLLEKAPEIISGLVTALVESLPLLVTAAFDLMLALTMGIIENLPLLIESGMEIIGALIGGILELAGSLFDVALDLVSKFGEFFRETDWLSIGKNILEGIINGVLAMAGAVQDAIKNVASGIFNGFKDFFGIASPSKLMAEQGGYLIEGVAEGMEDKTSLLENTTDDISEMIKSDLSDVDPKENNLDQWISDLDSAANAGVPVVIENIVSMFSEMPQKIYDSISSTADLLTEWANSLTQISTSKFTEFTEAIYNITSQVPGKVNDALDPAKNVVEVWGNAIIDIGRTKMEEFVDVIVNITSQVPQKVSDAIEPTIGVVSGWIDSLVSTVQTKMPAFVTAAVTAAKPVVEEFKTIGVQMVEGLWAGVDSKSSWLYNNIADFAKNIAKTVKDELDINSPSRVMMTLGEFTAQGFIDGFVKVADRMDATLGDIFNPDLSVGADFTGISGFSGQQVAMAGGGNVYNYNINQEIKSVPQSPRDWMQAADAQFRWATRRNMGTKV